MTTRASSSAFTDARRRRCRMAASLRLARGAFTPCDRDGSASCRRRWRCAGRSCRGSRSAGHSLDLLHLPVAAFGRRSLSPLEVGGISRGATGRGCDRGSSLTGLATPGCTAKPLTGSRARPRRGQLPGSAAARPRDRQSRTPTWPQAAQLTHPQPSRHHQPHQRWHPGQVVPCHWRNGGPIKLAGETWAGALCSSGLLNPVRELRGRRPPGVPQVRTREKEIFHRPRTLPGTDLNDDVQLSLLNRFATFYEDMPFTAEGCPISGTGSTTTSFRTEMASSSTAC